MDLTKFHNECYQKKYIKSTKDKKNSVVLFTCERVVNENIQWQSEIIIPLNTFKF